MRQIIKIFLVSIFVFPCSMKSDTGINEHNDYTIEDYYDTEQEHHDINLFEHAFVENDIQQEQVEKPTDSSFVFGLSISYLLVAWIFIMHHICDEVSIQL